MTFIVFFALITLACIITALIVGLGTHNEDVIAPAIIALCAWGLLFIGFQWGAKWQQEFINEKSTITAKP